jgi:hypothetical protein
MGAAQIDVSQGAELKANPGYVLRKDAAKAWDAAVIDYGKEVLITGAWRSYETQERIFRERYRVGARSPYGDYRTWQGKTWGRVTGAAAAVPGTSNHGGGVAVDVKTSRDKGDPAYPKAVVFTAFSDPDRLAFLKVAAKHGWYDDEGRSVGELWHLTYYPERDKRKGRPTRKAYHTRVTTRATHVNSAPGKDDGRLLPVGYRFSVIDGSGRKVRGQWWVKTTAGNWIRSGSTRKV